jgi:uracil-DNA glycosylase
MIFARDFLREKLRQGAYIYPEPQNIFRAFNETPFDKVRVVILGQDPYHGPMQANGLCFSVNKGITLPPSLVNIFKELESDLGIPRPSTGDLLPWAQQGVLLLNSILTVEVGKPGSHRMLQWEKFTDRAISELSSRRKKIVFLLWGAYAMSKIPLIDQKKHRVISGPHPSPLSAYKGFFGSKPFSKVNQELQDMGVKPIDWKLS